MRQSTDARPYIISGSATMLEFVLSLRSGLVLSLVVCGGVGHPQPPHRDGHPCTVEVLPGPTGVI